jgi:formylglycine-generating enzyme required for sulfatase activity
VRQLAILMTLVVAAAGAAGQERPAAPGAARGGADFVLLKNGDDLLGQLMVSGIRIKTDWGTVVFAKQAVVQILASKGGTGEVVLSTSDGDRVTGRLEGGYFRVARTSFAPLDIDVADIAEVSITPKPEDLQRPAPATLIVLQNGDALRADLYTRSITLEADSRKSTVSLANVRLIDIDRFEGATGARVVHKSDDRRFHGKLLETELRVITRSGQELAVPSEKIASIASGLPPQLRSIDAAAAPAFAAPGRKPKVLRERLRVGGLAPEVVEVPPGRFRRGDLHADGDPDEQPVRQVQIPKSFAIGRYPVTFEEYDLFCERTGRRKPDDEGWGRGRRPVVNVSWRDATDYSQWLSEQTGAKYRLPTNSEFEYAARAGVESRYPWGNELGRDQAVCAGCGSMWDSAHAAPVGRFPANAFGLHDMSGNVWQWVQDCWDIDYKSAPLDGGPYLAEGSCDKRIVRGGSWTYPARETRVANRWRDFSVRPSDDTGFRVVRELR